MAVFIRSGMLLFVSLALFACGDPSPRAKMEELAKEISRHVKNGSSARSIILETPDNMSATSGVRIDTDGTIILEKGDCIGKSLKQCNKDGWVLTDYAVDPAQVDVDTIKIDPPEKTRGEYGFRVTFSCKDGASWNCVRFIGFRGHHDCDQHDCDDESRAVLASFKKIFAIAGPNQHSLQCHRQRLCNQVAADFKTLLNEAQKTELAAETIQEKQSSTEVASTEATSTDAPLVATETEEKGDTKNTSETLPPIHIINDVQANAAADRLAFIVDPRPEKHDLSEKVDKYKDAFLRIKKARYDAGTLTLLSGSCGEKDQCTYDPNRVAKIEAIPLAELDPKSIYFDWLTLLVVYECRDEQFCIETTYRDGDGWDYRDGFIPCKDDKSCEEAERDLIALAAYATNTAPPPPIADTIPSSENLISADMRRAMDRINSVAAGSSREGHVTNWLAIGKKATLADDGKFEFIYDFCLGEDRVPTKKECDQDKMWEERKSAEIFLRDIDIDTIRISQGDSIFDEKGLEVSFYDGKPLASQKGQTITMRFPTTVHCPNEPACEQVAADIRFIAQSAQTMTGSETKHADDQLFQPLTEIFQGNVNPPIDQITTSHYAEQINHRAAGKRASNRLSGSPLVLGSMTESVTIGIDQKLYIRRRQCSRPTPLTSSVEQSCGSADTWDQSEWIITPAEIDAQTIQIKRPDTSVGEQGYSVEFVCARGSICMRWKDATRQSYLASQGESALPTFQIHCGNTAECKEIAASLHEIIELSRPRNQGHNKQPVP